MDPEAATPCGAGRAIPGGAPFQTAISRNLSVARRESISVETESSGRGAGRGCVACFQLLGGDRKKLRGFVNGVFGYAVLFGGSTACRCRPRQPGRRGS